MVVELILGFCEEELKLLAPVQAYVAPDVVEAPRFNFCPAHSGPLLDATGALGTGVTVTVTELLLKQPVAVIVSFNV